MNPQSFQKIVREMQIEPNSYYLETIIRQSLVNNFAINCNFPKVNTGEDTPPEAEPSRQSIFPSNWSDYLQIENDTDDEGPEQTEPLTDIDPDHPTTSRGTCVSQNLGPDSNAVL